MVVYFRWSGTESVRLMSTYNSSALPTPSSVFENDSASSISIFVTLRRCSSVRSSVSISLTWIKAWIALTCYVLNIFRNLFFFLKPWPLIVCLYATWLFFWEFTRLKWSLDLLCPKLKEISPFKLQDVNVLENSRYFFQNLYLAWLYVVLNGESENVLFFCHYFLFCLVLVPLQCIYVVIEIKEINL